jgi:hypothetical protein
VPPNLSHTHLTHALPPVPPNPPSPTPFWPRAATTATAAQPSPAASPATAYAWAASPAAAASLCSAAASALLSRPWTLSPFPGWPPPLPDPSQPPPDATDLDRLCRLGSASPRRHRLLPLADLMPLPVTARWYAFLIATASSTKEYYNFQTHF